VDSIPHFPANWKEELSIKLTQREAEFLRTQIITSTSNTILGFVLETDYSDFVQFKSFDDLEGILNLFPENLKADYILAKEFADFIYGAQLRYNMILSQGKSDDVNAWWELWKSGIEKHVRIDLHELVFERLQIKNGRLIKFLFDCQEAMVSKDFEKLDELIVLRERRLKGDKRAKLSNVDAFDYKGWVGIGKLQYRLRNGQNLLKDIFEGLGENDA